MDSKLALPHDEIAAFCQRHRVTRLALFGSVLRPDFGPDSDLDLLVEFAPDAQPTLSDLLAMEAELSGMLGRHVDLGEERAVQQDPNYIRRERILQSAQVIYEDG